MEMKLYNTVDNDNVINKELNLIHTLQIKLKDNVSITNPIIILSKVTDVNYFECNYCFLSEFNRYYFIRDIEVMDNTNFRFMLECDVLESFKNDILNSHSSYKRGLKTGDYLQFNNTNDVRKDIEIYSSNITLEMKKTMILSTMGVSE